MLYDCVHVTSMIRLADEPENPGLMMKCTSDVSVMISRCQGVASFHIASPDIESSARTPHNLHNIANGFPCVSNNCNFVKEPHLT